MAYTCVYVHACSKSMPHSVSYWFTDTYVVSCWRSPAQLCLASSFSNSVFAVTYSIDKFREMDVFSVFDFYRLDIPIAGLYLNIQRNIETSDSAEEDEHIWLKENTLYIVYCILYGVQHFVRCMIKELCPLQREIIKKYIYNIKKIFFSSQSQ